jgi:type I restriction enzyme S subunit
MTRPLGSRRGWRKTTLGEIGDYMNGRGFKKSEWSDRGRMIIRIQDLTGTGAAPNHFHGHCDERHVVRDGDLLISWAATLDAFLWRGPEAVLNQHIFKVTSAIDRRFHFYLVKRVLGDIRQRAHGSGMVHITKGEFERTPVLLPDSMDEQARIADEIEQQLTRIDAAQAVLTRSTVRARTLRASILDRAWDEINEGRLSDKEWHNLSELSWDSDYGTSQKATEDASGPPIVRIPNIRGGMVDLAGLKYATRPAELRADRSLQPGDLLVVRTNGSRDLIGRAAVVESPLTPDHFHASYLIRFRLKGEPALWRWISLVWPAPKLRRRIEALAATSAGQYNLSLRSLSSLRLPIPKPGRLEASVAQLEQALSYVDELEREVQMNLRRLPGLRRMILRQALPTPNDVTARRVA